MVATEKSVEPLIRRLEASSLDEQQQQQQQQQRAMSAPTVDAEVQKLLEKHDFLELVTTGEGDEQRVRIKCQLTGHELLPRAEAVATHLQSKKFRKARDWYCHDFSQYEPYLVPHRRLPKCLYCNVTGIVLNRIPAEVEKHVNGKKYKRMKQHVKITVKSGDGDEEPTSGSADFDADAFEFENSQVIYSDAEDEEQEEEEEDESVAKAAEQEEDDMSDLYPDEDEEDVGSTKPIGDVAMDTEEQSKPKQKKRAAKSSAAVPKKHRHHAKKAKKAE